MKKKMLIGMLAAAVMMAMPVHADPLATAETDAGKISIIGYDTQNIGNKDYLVCLLDYENKGTEASSAGQTFSVTAYQDGVQIMQMMLIGEGGYEDYKDCYTNVLPGTPIKVYQNYELNGTTGEIVLEIREMISYSPEPLATCTFNLSDDGTPDPAEASDQAEAPADAAPADDAIAALEQRIADLEQRVSALENQ